MKRIAMIVATLALLAPAPAFAATSATCNAYTPETCDLGPNLQSTRQTSTSGSLPFTGLDVVVLAIGGSGLLALGVVIRRVSVRRI